MQNKSVCHLSNLNFKNVFQGELWEFQWFDNENQVTQADTVRNRSNCATWTSCREGCTAHLFLCYHVRVRYSLEPFQEGKEEEEVEEWEEFPGEEEEDPPLLVTANSCGYPPEVNCTRFIQKVVFKRDCG